MNAEERIQLAQENLQLAQKLYDLTRQADIKAVQNLLTKDVEWDVTGPPDILPFAGKRKGREQAAEYFKLNADNVAVTSFEILEMIAQDDKVMSVIREGAYHRVTGRAYVITIAHLLVFREGKLAQFHNYLETGPLIAAFLDRDV